jgi:hypothetical protein
LSSKIISWQVLVNGGAFCLTERVPLGVSECTTIPIWNVEDLAMHSPMTTRILLPNDMSGEALASLLKGAIFRGFTKFVINDTFRKAVIHHYCSKFIT